jgi:hypothetical protein
MNDKTLDYVSARLSSCRPLTQEEINSFVQLGIPGLALVKPLCLAAADVSFGIRGRFEFESEANDKLVSAMIIPAIGHGGLIDLIAWLPKSGALASWLGAAFCLGDERQIDGPYLGDPLQVWRSPVSWLKAERRGIVIVEKSRASDRLRDVPELLCEDPDHAHALRGVVSSPPIVPRVISPSAKIISLAERVSA